tara:strand:+ start:302 stop:955 length:654 start_codon:yes stop_codon:yes gene_type:complete
MKLGGLQKQTLIDYPGKVACTVFTIGCNFRCPFCYNADLVLEIGPEHSEKEFFDFLKERKEFLDGVVICGGEPTIHKDLPEFCKKIKELGFLVSLDTNGSNPEMLKELIDSKLVDTVSMDIKAPKSKYAEVAGAKVDLDKIERSIAILRASNIDYEFRTTVVPTLLAKEDCVEISKWVGKNYRVQNFSVQENLIDQKLKQIKPFSKEEFEDIRRTVS